jgi:serine protease
MKNRTIFTAFIKQKPYIHLMRKQLLLIVAACVALFSAESSLATNPNHNASGNSSQKISLKPGSYKSGVVIVKMKAETRAVCQPTGISVPSVNEKLLQLGTSEVRKYFPKAVAPAQTRSANGMQLVDLSLIYKIRIDESISMENALELLRNDNSIEYAEPEYLHSMNYTPNDPSIGNQYHLNSATGGVYAYTGWDIWKGDTNTVVGIIDSGTDWDHPDLVNNIKYNYNDPIDGVDNDSDGFTDNFRGWDVSMDDNNPMVVGSTHGSHVSGCATASTDNGTGVAGPGFKCKFLPVKVSLDASTTAIDNGYDGIVYAADHGVNVINLSWGRGGGFSAFEQSIIDYAAGKDVTVVAAAGNDNTDQAYYPASYEHVVSVAATTNTDSRASFSNYHYSVDVSAPGNNIFATVANNTYTYMSGTSMASPVAAGCAAVVKSYFPSYNCDQVAMRLRATADNHYSAPGNSAYAYKLGKGRVNLYKALTDTLTPGIAMNLQSIVDNNDNVFVANDTMRLVIRFKNLLHPTSSAAVATMTVASTNVQLIGSSSFPIGVLNTLDTISNFAAAFQYKVKPTAPVNAVIPFRCTVTDGTYTDFYSFTITVNVDYINVEVNDISTSQTSKGRIGYNLTGQAQGLGFKYMGSPTLLYEASLLIGDGVHQVDDAVRSATAYDEDFAYNLRVTQSSSPNADFYANGIMNENGPTSLGSRMNILVYHNTYAWNTNPDRKYVIVEYIIKNTGSSPLSNVFAGIFADWDVPNVSATTDYSANVDSVDVARRLGYIRNTSPDGYWVATKLLSNTAGFSHYAIDNVTGGNGGANIYDGYDETEKYTTLSTSRAFAGGTAPTGNDVCDVTSTGPITIAVGDSVKVAFALIGGLDLASIQSSADAAQTKYNNLNLGVPAFELNNASSLTISPNPVTKNSVIRFSVHKNTEVELSVYNSVGEKIQVILNDKLSAGEYSYYPDLNNLAAGSYIVRLTAGSQVEMQRLMIVK